MPPGYSGTPLAKKLGVREGSTVALVGAPSGFSIPDLPPGVSLRRSARGPSDVTLWFVHSAAELESRIAEMASARRPERSLDLLAETKLRRPHRRHRARRAGRGARERPGRLQDRGDRRDLVGPSFCRGEAPRHEPPALSARPAACHIHTSCPSRCCACSPTSPGTTAIPLGVVDGALVGPDDRQRVAHRARLQRDGLHRRPRQRRVADLHAERRASPRRAPPRRGGLVPRGRAGLAGSATPGTRTSRRPRSTSALQAGTCVPGLTPDHRTWIDAPLSTLPDWTLVELASPAAVEDLTGPLLPEHDHVVYWAFIESGVIRAALLRSPFRRRRGRGDRLGGAAAHLAVGPAPRDSPRQGLAPVVPARRCRAGGRGRLRRAGREPAVAVDPPNPASPATRT